MSVITVKNRNQCFICYNYNGDDNDGQRGSLKLKSRNSEVCRDFLKIVNHTECFELIFNFNKSNKNYESDYSNVKLIRSRSRELNGNLDELTNNYNCCCCCCDQCLPMLESFCETFKTLENLRAQLRSELEAIACAIKVKTENVQEFQVDVANSRAYRNEILPDFPDPEIEAYHDVDDAVIKVESHKSQEFQFIDESEELLEHDDDDDDDTVSGLNDDYGVDDDEQDRPGKIRQSPQCPICSKTFTKSSTLTRHLRYHKNDRKFLCSYCDKRFVTPYDKECHESRHLGKGSIKCRYCDFLAFSHADRLHHERKEHSLQAGEIRCSFCDKSFGSISARNKHELVHTNDREFKCSFCEKSFKTMSNKNRHEKSHQKTLPPFRCTSCSFIAWRGDHLRRHEETLHQNQKRK